MANYDLSSSFTTLSAYDVSPGNNPEMSIATTDFFSLSSPIVYESVQRLLDLLGEGGVDLLLLGAYNVSRLRGMLLTTTDLFTYIPIYESVQRNFNPPITKNIDLFIGAAYDVGCTNIVYVIPARPLRGQLFPRGNMTLN